MKDLGNVSEVLVGPEGDQQRIDNFLLRQCKGVPRSHIYRILRTGEVRVNGGRVDATRRVVEGDRVRIPPIRVAERSAEPGKGAARAPSGSSIPAIPVVHEDDALIVVDKPAGLAVHGGSGLSFGLIEALRALRPQARFLELVHRLDRETSGLLLVAKKRSALTALHAQLREGGMYKRYLALGTGPWQGQSRAVDVPLRKYLTGAGERRVSVDKSEGREARTMFRLERRLGRFTLLSAELDTGRTHQIRVHLAHLGCPIAGDDKYGDFDLNRELSRNGLKRMFLHAAELRFTHPLDGATVQFKAPLPRDLQGFVDRLDADAVPMARAGSAGPATVAAAVPAPAPGRRSGAR
jgi:23S rRNA pseudouridine955/2504/2580 synthase